ncbi:MAG: hypothetical protein K0Q57_625 [Gammaproteobacteria bacterium]|jgi:hypothetical protein|nr:hypothetical protein [Gammaproteobacteria bacterium]
MLAETSQKDPKTLFLQLFSIVTLYISFSTMLTLLFTFINLQWGKIGYLTSIWGMQMQLSTLLIAFAAYAWSCFRIRKAAQPIRKFFVYLTLFLLGLLILGDAISVIYYFLSGGITLAFVLKALTLFALSTGVIYFYFIDGKQGVSSGLFKTYMAVSTVIVILTLAYAFYTVGSPTNARLAGQDAKRTWDLQQIQSQISSYYKHKKQLPASLGALTDPISGYKAPIDEVTNKPYGYQVISAKSFSLCAEFALPSSMAVEKIVSYWGADGWNWEHPKGYYCFVRTIDPQMLN